MGGREKSEPRGLVEAYRAALLLRLLTGWGYIRVCKALKKLGYEISTGTVSDWFYRNRKPRFTPSSFERALFYHKAYKLALETKKQHPEWGHVRIATYISKQLPIRIPAITVYYWITGRSRPNITPVKPCLALGYLVGVLVGDYIRAGGGLCVKDKEFIEYYVKKYEEVTGIRLNIHPKEDKWCTHESGSWLRELWYSGLWRVVAYAYPIEFLKGLYDSEGSIKPKINWKKNRLYDVEVSLAVSDMRIKEYVKPLLEKYGFHVSEYFPGEYGCLYFSGWEALKRFAKLIGFREGKRRRRLELLLKIRSLPQRKRLEEWTKHYIKVKGRWVERAPNPRAR